MWDPKVGGFRSGVWPGDMGLMEDLKYMHHKLHYASHVFSVWKIVAFSMIMF